MDKVGDSLEAAGNAYRDAVKRLNGSSQSVVSKLKRLEEYGVKNEKRGKAVPRRFAAEEEDMS